MILSKHHGDLVENGRKTLLVLPRDHGRRRQRFTEPSSDGEQVLNVDRSPTVGTVIAIYEERAAIRHRAPTIASEDRRHSEEIVKRRHLRCHVKVTARFECFLHELTEQQVKALGFAEPGDLYAWWRESFERVEPPASTDDPAIDIPVLVVSIQREEHRFPVAAGGVIDPLHPAASDPAGYVDGPGGAMQDAGESPPKEITDKYSREADQAAALEGGRREAKRRKQWERAQRIERIEALTRLTGIDVSSDLRVIDQRLDRIEGKLGRRAA